jgi:hypothetical protein
MSLWRAVLNWLHALLQRLCGGYQRLRSADRGEEQQQLLHPGAPGSSSPGQHELLAQPAQPTTIIVMRHGHRSAGRLPLRMAGSTACLLDGPGAFAMYPPVHCR